MPFKFETLRVWQLAFDLADEIHCVVQGFPKAEMFSLSNQMKRAADSVVLNIAEGSTGSTNPETKRFLNIALKSAIETVACLMMAKRRTYIADIPYQQLYTRYEQLCKMITAYRNSLP